MQFKSITLVLIALVCQLTTAAPNPQTADVSSTSTLPSTLFPTVTSSVPTYSGTSTPTSNDACAQLARATATARLSPIIVSAEAAWNCLQAVPFEPVGAEAWVESLKPYVRWQSTLAYIKNPPTSYRSPAFDVYGSFDQITANIRNGSYRNQYEFEYAVYNTFLRAYDGHFSYTPNLVGNIVSFARPFALVSVSSDGQELPKPYVYSDVILSYNNTSFRPSAIVSIDGENVTTHLERFSEGLALHDPDSRWNNLFLQLSAVQQGPASFGPGSYAGGGRGDLYYPNATTSLTFENGTTRIYNNTARLLVNFTQITSAQDLYARYVNPPTVRATGGVTCTSQPAPGYPRAVLRTACNTIGGYYLNSTDYDDVAVLSVNSFQLVSNGLNLSLAFLDQAKAAGKTKLIIDLSANGGGLIAFGFVLFAKLFPNIYPYQGTRFRATEVFDIIGQTISDYSNGTSDIPPRNGTGDFYNTLNSNFFNGNTPFPYRSDLDENLQPFPSWQAKFGPHTYNGDNFTSIITYNFSQPAQPINLYRALFSLSGPLFEPENIILLTDGYCASTCSSFVEYMTQQAGIKTVTVGGRPSREPVQVVGGTRGANSYGFSIVQSLVRTTYNLTQRTKSSQEVANLYSNTEVGEYLGANNTDPSLSFKRGGGYANSVNSRDSIRRNDTNQVPLQFLYQAADCRIFWTADMTVDITSLWREVYDVTWGDGQCVAGSIQNSTSSRVKRSAKERVERRRLQRRSLSSAELDALADSVNLFTDHYYNPSVDIMETS